MARKSKNPSTPTSATAAAVPSPPPPDKKATLYSSGSGSDSDSDDLPAFGVNKAFAEAYKAKKQTEELSKLQDKYGKDLAHLSDDDDDDSEESLSDDDSDAELVTPQVDVAILKTLAKIRSKDPSVYQSGKQVFDEEEQNLGGGASTLTTTTKSSSKAKPVLLKDYQRQRLIDDPTFSRPDSIPDPSFSRPTFAQEEQSLKDEVKRAFHEAADSDDEGDMLVKRSKTVDEARKEEEEYKNFLESNVGAQAVKQALQEEEKFLNEYILSRGWIDKKSKKNRVPSYKEITGADSDSGSGSDRIEEVKSLKKSRKSREAIADKVANDLLARSDDEAIPDPAAHDSEDSEFEDKAEEFEHKYNFRFEEAEGSSLVTHARDVTSSIRKPTTTVTARQRARDAAKEKKDQEKLERKEEVRRLKALKRKEVEAKLAQLIEAAGEGTKGLEQIDLDGDWDPEEHDRRMREVYGDDYLEGNDDGFKPTWDDDVDIGDIEEVDDDEVGYAMGGQAEDAEGGMEFEAEDEDDEGEGRSGKQSKRKAKRDSKKRKRDEEGFPTDLLEAARAGGDEARQRLLDAMVDEYYALDHEDKIGDLPTRFKYAKVEPSNYNLSAEEILLATDAELNAFMSLRKLAPYRREEDKLKASKQKKKLKELRDAIRARKWGENTPEDGDEPLRKKKKWSEETGKKKKSSASSVGGGEDGAEGGKKSKRAGKSERKRQQKAREAVPTANGEDGTDE